MPVVVLFGSLILVEIVLRPINGLIILGFVSYALPSGLSFSGISPGLAITGITLIGALIHIFINGNINKFSKIWYILFFMFLYSIFVLFKSPNSSWFNIYNFIQGVTPFLLFSILVKNEEEGRKLIKYWLIAFFCFSIIQFMRNILDGPTNYMLLQRLAESRNNEASGFNPNVLAWTGLLYLPLAPTFAFSTNDPRERRKWWFVFFGIVMLIIFLFSRAAMIGLIISFILLIGFSFKQIENKNIVKFIFPLIIGFLLLYFIWEYAVYVKVMDTARLITKATLLPAIQERWYLIVEGWRMVAIRPWSGWGTNISFGTHSGFTKAALEYGLIYFFMYCIPFIYFILTSIFISRFHLNPETKLLGSGMLVVGIVAVILGIFGITMFASGYAQVFWLFVGYLHLAKKESIALYNNSIDI